MRKSSVKNIRINEEIYRELAEIIRSEVKDPRIPTMCSVVAVECAPDLKTCKVYVSVLGGDDELDKAMEGLKSSAGFIRRELARRVNLRNTPELHFMPDRSIAYGVDMIHKIDGLNISKEESENEA